MVSRQASRRLDGVRIALHSCSHNESYRSFYKALHGTYTPTSRSEDRIPHLHASKPQRKSWIGPPPAFCSGTYRVQMHLRQCAFTVASGFEPYLSGAIGSLTGQAMRKAKERLRLHGCGLFFPFLLHWIASCGRSPSSELYAVCILSCKSSQYCDL